MKEVINLEVTSYLSNIFNKGFNLGETTLCNTLTKDSSLLLTVRTMIDLVNSNKDSFESNVEVPVLVISKYPAHEIIKLIADEIVKLYPEYEDSVTYRDVLVKFTENTPYEIYVSQIEKLNSPITLGNDIRMIFIPEYDEYNNGGFEREFLRILRNHCSKNEILLFLTKVREDIRRFDLGGMTALELSQLTQEVDRCVWIEMEEDSEGVTRTKARLLKHRDPEPIPYEHIELLHEVNGICTVFRSN